DLQPGYELQHLRDGRKCIECFLVTMTVHQRALGRFLQRQIESAGRCLARQKFLKRERERSKLARSLALQHGGKSVRESQDTARLEPEDGHAACNVGRQCCNYPFRLDTRLMHLSD